MKNIINRKASKKVTSYFRHQNRPVRKESGITKTIAVDKPLTDYDKKEGDANGEIRTNKSG